ncbi:MAG TPA: PQQ-binding-like beta-propeller repeat protein [Vicinamibacterales bacterium]|nr:PQQ-binding-like beta-propeller repeat protein [Vicinamibacterales bacterium]
MRSAISFLVALVLSSALPASAGQAGAAADGAATYERACAACHAGGSGAPTRDVLRAMSPEAILNALVNGKMQLQGSSLSDAERRAVAEFLAGRPLGTTTETVAAAAKCTSSPPMTDPSSGPAWNGWGNGVTNTRYARSGGLTAADLPRLKLKWAFGYAGVSAARAQPTLAGGRLFVASENGELHALDPKTGCIHWTYKAAAGVRTAPMVAPYTRATGSGYAVYFGDGRANAYAVDAATGELIWMRKVDDHAAAAITGSLTVHDGRVFVPVQGLNEEGQGGRGGYPCCTFRGSLVALDANTGAVLWKTYTVDEPKPRAKNKDGVQMWGPAGGGIWAAPTVDARRGRVYVATGNGYADPPQPMTNAVIAMDIQTGKVIWVRQTVPNDQWTMGCRPQNPDNPACPATLGPDYDFSASPALATVDGRDLLVLPQKSGMMYAIDPDDGSVVWETRIGQGSGLGGQWGAAVDERRAYTGVSDLLGENPGGMRAIDLATGRIVWSVPPQPRLCGTERACRAAQGAAVTVIPGAVLSGSLDGGMRAYSTADGSIIWQVDTNTEYKTVNGVRATGGGMDGPGAIVAGGMVYFNSGYGGILNRPGNVLLAFGID